MEIAYMWYNASVSISYIDPDLAHRCFIEDSYWHDPTSWTEAKVRESGIALDLLFIKNKRIIINRKKIGEKIKIYDLGE